MNLNKKDRAILAELDLNARATYQEIGRKTRLSKETVIYRIKNLEKRGIIERYTTLVNFAQLGYTGFAVFNRFQNVTEQIKQEIIEHLKSIPELYWIGLVGGKFDIVFGIMCKSVFDFNKIYYSILTKYGKYLVDNTITIRTELRQYKRDYLVASKPLRHSPPYFGKQPAIESLDELDSNILSILSNNARMPVMDLSRILKQPASTLSLRIKKLEKKGLIQGYWTYIRPQKFGMQSYRLLLYLQNMDEQSRARLFTCVNENPHMLLAIETVGEWNFEITLEVETHEELQRYISDLRNQFSSIIKKIEFIIMFEDDLVYDPYPLIKHERSKLLL
jgi:Lrp/AsnC family transcriptional regulator